MQEDHVRRDRPSGASAYSTKSPGTTSVTRSHHRVAGLTEVRSPARRGSHGSRSGARAEKHDFPTRR